MTAALTTPTPPVATRATGPIQCPPHPRTYPDVTTADLPADPSSGEAWPLYPVHAGTGWAAREPFADRRRRQPDRYTCCDRAEVSDERVDPTAPTCAGRHASDAADHWRKRLRYADGGWILPLIDWSDEA